MAFQGASFLERRRLKRAQKRVADLVQGADAMNMADIARAEGEIERMRHGLDEAERAVASARAALIREAPVPGPEQCDWSMRGDLWREPVRPRGGVEITSPTRLSPAITLYHDCPAPELSFRQMRNQRPGTLARYQLALDVYRFGGGFISLVQDLPEPAMSGLTLAHYFGVSLEVAHDHPLEIYARLNLQHGPNTEQMVREMPAADGLASAEFDLAYTRVNEKRIEKIWLDLIFEAPQMNRIVISDMTVTRAPRADI